MDREVSLNWIFGATLEKAVLISIGAVLGANARFWIADWVAQKWGTSFPYGTVLINLSGSFLIGLFLTLATERFLVDPRLRLLVAVGFLGAYTTFSTFSFESFSLLYRGQWLLGILNTLGSTLIGIVAVGLGVYLGKSL
jgi:CrcB protein